MVELENLEEQTNLTKVLYINKCYILILWKVPKERIILKSSYNFYSFQTEINENIDAKFDVVYTDHQILKNDSQVKLKLLKYKISKNDFYLNT